MEKENESIERFLIRTKKHKALNHQDNIAFEDETHKYHHPKDETGNAEYISVTSLIDRFFPFDMDRFIQVKAKKEGISEYEVLNEFLRNRDEAAEKGATVRTALQKEAASFEELPSYAIKQVQGSLKAIAGLFKKFLGLYRGVRPEKEYNIPGPIPHLTTQEKIEFILYYH